MLRILALIMVLYSIGSYAGSDLFEQCQKNTCMAIVDAGSTGSRLHIYAYQQNDRRHPIHIREIWVKKITPGFASLSRNEETIHSYLDLLFGGVSVKNLPVYFYATAGMRLYSYPKQQLYYQALQRWFADKPQWQLMDARTITGQDEGLYGWLAVNYQLGKFSHEEPLAGVMDMGGASVQVVFPIEDTSGVDKNNLREVEVSGRRMTLFIHSFLGLGQTVLSQQFLDTANCFARDYHLPNDFSAAGDAGSCEQEVSKLINQVHDVDRIVKPVISKNSVAAWYAMGGLPALLEGLPFNFTNQEFTNQSLLQQADNEVCHKGWQDLQAQYPENEYLYGYCLFSSYYYALMVEGYGLAPSQPIHYIPTTQNTDWTLGVVLHQP